MKKFLCIALCITLASICLTSCKKDNKNSVKGLVDIASFAKKGQIDTCKYKIGDNADDVVSALKEKANAAQDEADSICEVYEGNEYTTIVTSNVNYYYNNDDKEKGISCIACLKKAFGFELGTDLKTIKEAEENFKLSGTERSLTEKEAKMLNAYYNSTALEYDFSKCRIIFIFENNCLMATLISEK